MPSRHIFGLLLLACVPIAAQMGGGLPAGMQMMGGGAEESETHNAEELDTERFEERLAEFELLLVFFRESGGQQTQQIDKEFELAATELSVSDEAIFVGLVDLKDDKAKGAAKKAKVTQGPVAKCFRRGKPLDLGPNGFDARSLVNFMRYLSAPVSKVLPNSTAINEFLRDAGDMVVLGIFADRNRPTHNVWIKNAEALRPPFRFVEASVESAQGSKLLAGVTLDETKNQFAVVPPAKWVAKTESTYFLSSDFKGMKEFIYEHALTKVAPMTSYAHRRYKSEGRSLVALSFDQGKLGKMFKYFVNRLHKVFAEEPDLVSRFAFTIWDKNDASSIAADFGVPKDKDFVVTVSRLDTLDKWGTDMLTNMTADNFSALPLIPYLKLIEAGVEPAFVKSEAPPDEEPSPGKVATVVAKTWASIVEDETLDVLLALYTQKAPADALPMIASAFRKVSSVRVAQMNATANAFNYSRFRIYSDEAHYFMLNASAKGKSRPVPFDGKGGGKVEPLELGELLLKHMVTSSETGDAADIRKQMKQMRKAKNAELAEQAAAMGLPQEPKKKKKKRRSKGKPKEEL
mmetsp:Transcript_4204/g.9226  ORF Transcript_4204/g.9226 Transcript_4204/m.9226 type:complete len:574 (-) Transcript_4204:164-1885(-)|eukprot:CAMPEP_0174728898 /NCGR_PEP_ID=MMETSP1094-20130205/52620_1 /TAXON_ID=156173 /ORGANISM="Chrysochromulina brevifilum, Strain UTEX LB 985" /LENGTH=573 /DNA_ID=CAMNT_0015930907 /DNA_START=83 /DNA_END=1804 /DNA_ORIENTATION=-